MGGLPDILVIVDTNKESIAVTEAKKLGLPVIAVLDSNSSPTDIRYPVPGNDDASRAINLYCDLFVQAVLDGLQAEMSASGMDMGEIEPIEPEPVAAEPEPVAAEPEAAAPAEAVADAGKAPAEVAEGDVSSPEPIAAPAETPAEEPARA